MRNGRQIGTKNNISSKINRNSYDYCAILYSMVQNQIFKIEDASDLPESLREVFLVWDNLSKQGSGPLVELFSLESMPLKILPWSVVVDVLEEQGEYRFRFFGTERVQLIGVELTGKLLTQIPDEYMREGNRVEYNHVCEYGEPVLCRTPFTTLSGLSSVRLSVRLPMIDKNGKVSMIYSAMDPESLTDTDYQFFGTEPKI